MEREGERGRRRGRGKARVGGKSVAPVGTRNVVCIYLDREEPKLSNNTFVNLHLATHKSKGRLPSFLFSIIHLSSTSKRQSCRRLNGPAQKYLVNHQDRIIGRFGCRSLIICTHSPFSNGVYRKHLALFFASLTGFSFLSTFVPTVVVRTTTFNLSLLRLHLSLTISTRSMRLGSNN